jgi:hypothetical protein
MSTFVRMSATEWVNRDRVSILKLYHSPAVEAVLPGVEAEPEAHTVQVWFDGVPQPGVDALALYRNYVYSSRNELDAVMRELINE